MPAQTIDQIIAGLYAALATWAAANNGDVVLAEAPAHALELLAGSAPKAWRVVLLYDGDSPTEDIAEVGIVENRIDVVLKRNRGLALARGKELIEGTDARPAFLKLLSDLRDFVRGYSFGYQTAGQPTYKGAAAVADINGLPLDGYKLSFIIEAQLPDLT